MDSRKRKLTLIPNNTTTLAQSHAMNPDLPTSSALKTLSEAFPGEYCSVQLHHSIRNDGTEHAEYTASVVIGSECHQGRAITADAAVAECLANHASFDPFKAEREKLEAAGYIVTKP